MGAATSRFAGAAHARRLFYCIWHCAAAPDGRERRLAIIRGLLLRSDMLAAVSAHQLEAEIASGELCILPLELRHTSRAIGLTSRTASLHSPVAKALMDVIRQVIQEQPPEP